MALQSHATPSLAEVPDPDSRQRVRLLVGLKQLTPVRTASVAAALTAVLANAGAGSYAGYEPALCATVGIFQRVGPNAGRLCMQDRATDTARLFGPERAARRPRLRSIEPGNEGP